MRFLRWWRSDGRLVGVDQQLVPVDPYAGIVSGPLLVARTLRNRALHQARYTDDDGFPEIVWGTFADQHLTEQEGAA